MSDNIAAAKPRTECTGVVIDGKHYEGFDMYTAMEEISGFLSKIRLMVQDLYDTADTYAASYGKARRAGMYPSCINVFGHEVFTRSGIMLDNVVSIEAALKKFDIHTD